MPLLGDQDSVSKKTPMPINDVTVSTDIIQITSETVDFYFSSGGTRTVDAGQAAGVSVTITVDKAPIYNSEGTHVGDINDSSFSFDNTDTFDSEVLLNDMDRQTLERNDLSWASKLSTITSGLSNGEYKVDYLTGLIFGVKKDADTAEAVTYLTRGFQVVPVSSGGAATYHAEDAAHSSGDTGSMSLAVRNDALAALAGSDGDYAPLQVNATGALYVDSSSTDATHDSAVIATGPQVMLEAKDFDGSALPNAVAEGDATRPAVSLTGVSYTMLTDEDGSDTPLVAESAAIGAATGGTVGLMGMMEAQSTQKAAVTASDAVRPIANLNGEQVNAGHTWATNSNRAEEIDPISEHYAEEELIDTTNVAAATNYLVLMEKF